MIFRLISLIAGLIIIFLILKSIFEELNSILKERIGSMRAEMGRSAEVVEPPSEVFRENGMLILRLKMPHVELEDVEIRKMENSIEIKAQSKGKIYFKLLPIPRNYRVKDKRLEGDELLVRLVR
jgi:hypothetical protein